MKGKESTSVDVTNLPELLGLAEEVKRSNRRYVLIHENEELAVVTPAGRRKGDRGGSSLSAHEAFLASAGSWKGLVDTDALLSDIYESRSRSSRAPVEL